MFKGKTRWLVLLWLFVITLVSYMDRANLSVATPLILEEFKLTATQIGIVMSGLSIGYTLMNFPGGFLADRFSPKKILIIALVTWSVFTILTGVAGSLFGLLIIRILFGAAEGPLGPCNTKIVSNWMLPKERGTASGLWLSAMTMGVVVGAPLSGLIVNAYGWRSVFYIFGAAGIILAVLTGYLITSKPEEHRFIKKEELDLITKSNIPTSTKASASNALKSVLTSPMAWIIAFIYFGLTALYWANLGWLPTYFVKARGSSILSSGFYSAFPYICASLGPVVLGTVSDRLLKGWRTPLLIVAAVITMPAVIIAVNADNLTTSLIAFGIAAFTDFAAIGLMWTIPHELFPKDRVALTSGFMLMWGSAAGILAPIVMGVILEKTGSFNSAYYIFAVLALVAAILAIPLLAKEKAVRKAENAVSDTDSVEYSVAK